MGVNGMLTAGDLLQWRPPEEASVSGCWITPSQNNASDTMQRTSHTHSKWEHRCTMWM